MKRVGVLIGLFVVAVIGGWFGLTHFQAARATSSEVCSGAKASDFTCYQSYYQRKVAGEGVEASMKELETSFNAGNQFVKSDCHQLTHVIGRAASNRYPDVAEAYKHGDDFCSSGYYHGVMEGIVGRTGEAALVTQANTICAAFRNDPKLQYSLVHHNCTHGMGHGFMAVAGDELFDSLKMCDYLGDDWEKQSCYGGVFMENIMADINVFHSTKYLKADQPMYPCTAVAENYKGSCYFNQTSYALRQVNQDFAKVFAMCAEAPAAHRVSCYQSLGRDASGNVLSDINLTRSNCMNGSDYEARSNCVIGAVKDIIWHFNNVTPGNDFCTSLTTDLQPVCNTTAKEYYSTFKS